MTYTQWGLQPLLVNFGSSLDELISMHVCYFLKYRATNMFLNRQFDVTWNIKIQHALYSMVRSFAERRTHSCAENKTRLAIEMRMASMPWRVTSGRQMTYTWPRLLFVSICQRADSRSDWIYKLWYVGFHGAPQARIPTVQLVYCEEL